MARHTSFGSFGSKVIFSYFLLRAFIAVLAAGNIDISQRCYKDKDVQKFLPQCHLEVDLVRRQRCVDDLGMFLVLEEEAKEAMIVCSSSQPIEVELITETGSFLSYDENERFEVIHERTGVSSNAGQHSVTIPVVQRSDNRFAGDKTPVIKYTIRNAYFGYGNNETYSYGTKQGVEILVTVGGSSVLFSLGNTQPPAKSEIVYIPCLYDYTYGIKIHTLRRYEKGNVISLNAHSNLYNPFHGFRFNLTNEPNLYGNHTFLCIGESPSVNPNLVGVATQRYGYGVEFRAGITILPTLSKYECYTPPCQVYCEYDEPIHMNITKFSNNPQIILGKLLFRTFEGVTRYAVEFESKVGRDNIEVECIRSGDNSVLHEWQIVHYDILKPVTEQTLQFQLGPLTIGKENASRIIQCISSSSKIVSFVSLPCSNLMECRFYSVCVEKEHNVEEWESRWAVPKYCSAPTSVGTLCQSFSGGGSCKEITIAERESGRIFCKTENNINYVADYFTGFDNSIIFDPPNANVSPSAVVRVISHNEGDIHTGEAFWFTCETVSFFTEHGLQWKLKWRNGTLTPATVSDGTSQPEIWSSSVNPSRKSSILIESVEVVSVVCSAPLIDENGWIEHDFALNQVKQTVRPTFMVPKSSNIEVGSSANLECKADGYPPPEVNWVLDKEQQNSKYISVESSGTSSILKFTNFKELDTGDYLCVASQGNHKSSTKVAIAAKTQSWTIWIVLGVMASVLIVAFVAVLSFYRKWKTSQTMLQKFTDAEVDEFLNGIQGNADDYRFAFLALAAPYDANFELEMKNIQIDRNVCLGSGQFGVVYRAIINTMNDDGSQNRICAAVKTLKPSCKSDDIASFLREVKLMIYLGSHPNLVEMIGACTKNCRTGEVYLALELCDHGSLLKHLQQLSERFPAERAPHTSFSVPTVEEVGMKEMTSDSKYVNINATSTFGDNEFTELVQWSYEISSGMEFIANKGLIHGDIAARNILLQSSKNKLVAKISDFGLSRKLYEYTQYVKTKQEPLPWRWLAPESLRQLKFSTKSDVWAYGICLWEIFTLGDNPYSGYSYNMEFLNLLDEGFRNPKPKFANDKLYDLMKRCWLSVSDERPSFQDITTLVVSMCKDSNALIIQNYSEIL